MAKAPSEAPQPGIIARTIQAIKTAVKVVVGLFFLTCVLVVYLASRSQPQPESATPVTSTVPSSARPVSTAAAAPTATDPDPVARPAQPQPSPVAEVPEPVTVARPGGAGHAHVCPNREDYDELQRLLAAMDQGQPTLPRFSQMSQEFKILRIPNGTHALAIRTERGARLVRLTDGYRAGQSGWVDVKYVFPVSAPVATSEVKPQPVSTPEPPKPVDPEKRAETILGMGKNLERMGKASAALENYRRVLAEFPGTKAAAEAARKVEALAGK